MARIIELILTQGRTGRGAEKDPVRTVYELWTTDGNLVAQFDSHSKENFFDPPGWMMRPDLGRFPEFAREH